MLMKSILLFLLASISFCGFSQHGQIGTFIPIDLPMKSEMPKMGTTIGFGLSGAYSPFYTTPVFLELKASWGNYSSKTLRQTYLFDDGSQTTTDVSYSSSMHKYLLGTKVMIGGDYRAVRGYITPQIGVANFKTKIVIADPLDEDGCQALDRETTHRFAGFVYGGELGAQLSMEKLFKGISSENTHKLTISASYLSGFNHVEYVNVRYMKDEVHDTQITHTSDDINARFINVSTNQIHEHKIAELYHTNLRMIGINIGYVVNF
jgi:hypothetical protein